MLARAFNVVWGLDIVIRGEKPQIIWRKFNFFAQPSTLTSFPPPNRLRSGCPNNRTENNWDDD